MCPTYREVRLIQSNLFDLCDKFNMELDTNPTKPTKCIRLSRSPTYPYSDLPRVDCINISN